MILWHVATTELMKAWVNRCDILERHRSREATVVSENSDLPNFELELLKGGMDL